MTDLDKSRDASLVQSNKFENSRLQQALAFVAGEDADTRLSGPIVGSIQAL